MRPCDEDKRYIDLNDEIKEETLFLNNNVKHDTIELVDKETRYWSKYYRSLYPIKNSCAAQTKTILGGEVKFSSAGRTLMILGIILSSLKFLLSCLELVLFSKHSSTYYDSSLKTCLNVLGNVNLVFVITLLLFCHGAKKGIAGYTIFLNLFISR